MLEEQRRAVMAGVMSGPSKSGELSFFQKVPEKIKMLEINLSFLQVHSLLCSLLALLVHSYKYLQKSTFPSSKVHSLLALLVQKCKSTDSCSFSSRTRRRETQKCNGVSFVFVSLLALLVKYKY